MKTSGASFWVINISKLRFQLSLLVTNGSLLGCPTLHILHPLSLAQIYVWDIFHYIIFKNEFPKFIEFSLIIYYSWKQFSLHKENPMKIQRNFFRSNPISRFDYWGPVTFSDTKITQTYLCLYFDVICVIWHQMTFDVKWCIWHQK